MGGEGNFAKEWNVETDLTFTEFTCSGWYVVYERKYILIRLWRISLDNLSRCWIRSLLFNSYDSVL